MTRDLLLVTLSLFVWGMGEGMFIFFQAIYLQQWGASPVAIGGILGAMGVAMAAAQIPAGYLADRLGRRPVMWSSWFIGTTATWIMALAGSLPMFVAGLLMYGITSFVLAPMNSYITGARGSWTLGRALTVPSAMFNLGAVLGPLVGGQLGEQFGIRWAFVGAAILFVCSTGIVLFVRKQAIEQHNDEEKQSHLFQNRAFISYLAMIFGSMLAITLPQPLTQNYLQFERGLSLAEIGKLGSLGSLGSAVITLSLGRIHPGPAFLLGQALVGLFALLLWRTSGMTWWGLGYFLLGGYRLARAMTVAQSRPLVRPAEIGLAYGVTETVNSAAYILAPVLAGLLYERSPVLVYPVSLILIVLGIMVSGFFLMKQRQRSSNVTHVAEVPPM